MQTTRSHFVFFSCLFCSLFFLTPSYAQTGKGSMLLGGNGGIRFDSENNQKIFNAYLSPRIGLFVIDKLAIGIGLPLSINTSEDFENSSIGISPFIRYYIGGSKLIPFLEARGGFSRVHSRYKGTWGTIVTNNTNVSNMGLGLGAAYFITPAIGLEAIFAYDTTRFGYENGSSNRGSLSLNFGFQVYFSRNRE